MLENWLRLTFQKMLDIIHRALRPYPGLSVEFFPEIKILDLFKETCNIVDAFVKPLFTSFP